MYRLYVLGANCQSGCEWSVASHMLAPGRAPHAAVWHWVAHLHDITIINTAPLLTQSGVTGPHVSAPLNSVKLQSPEYQCRRFSICLNQNTLNFDSGEVIAKFITIWTECQPMSRSLRMIMLKGAPVSSPLSNDDDTSADHRVATAPPPETRVWCRAGSYQNTAHRPVTLPHGG